MVRESSGTRKLKWAKVKPIESYCGDRYGSF